MEAYRLDPGNHSAAARETGVQRRTSRRAYETGYPDRPWGVTPIKDLLMQEAELARARMQVQDDRAELDEDRAVLEADRDREASRQHAIRAKEEEGKMIRGTRVAVMSAIGASVKSAEGLQSAMTKLGSSLLEAGMRTEPLTMGETNALSAIMRRYASTLRELSQAGQTVMEMERLYLGEPTSIVGIETDLDTMPIEELVKLAGYQDEVLKRAHERGLVVLEGGLGKPTG